MRHLTLWLAAIAMVVAALFLVACECVPESDEDLCGQTHCGQTTLVDNCGEARDVDCGDCPEGRACAGDTCICEGQDRQTLCDELGVTCGYHTTTDRCDDIRQINCGVCTDPDVCVDGACQCDGESAAELCDQNDFDCGEAIAVDECGESRTIDCGDCTAPYECENNICDCEGESEAELCSDQGFECGQASVTDRCEYARDIDCGSCSSPDECIDHACECVAESDSELCDAMAGACGTVETTDVCGDTREVDCDPCPSGDTTFGAVRDGSTGELLSDALIRVYDWPPPEGTSSSWVWEANHRAGDPDYSTTTAGPVDDFNFEFATDEPICIDDQIDTLEAHQWYRFVVERDGYDTGIFYRLHPGYEPDDCPEVCPTTGDTGCNRQDFEIFSEDDTYLRYPNLVSDIREMEHHEWQCILLPDDHPEEEMIGLRVRIGGANVGPGAFHLEGVVSDDPPGDADGDVVQHIERSDGTTETLDVASGGFYNHGSHEHIHFVDWFRLSLIDPVDACRDVDDRSSDCILSDSLKISFCLHDLDRFDGDVEALYDGFPARFLDPPTCMTAEQGVTQGWRDTYVKSLPGQGIAVGPPDEVASIDTLWVEAEVDPEGVLHEVERDGNVGRITVEPPSDVATMCGDSSRTVDCSMPSSEYTTTEQRRHCGDYVD